MSDLTNKQISVSDKKRTSDGYCYLNKDGSVYLTSKFDQYHKSAGLIGHFDCYIYPKEKQVVYGRYGYWRYKGSKQKIVFKENDLMHETFKSEKLTKPFNKNDQIKNI